MVWASRETRLGLPFDRPPDYAPVDEEHVGLEAGIAGAATLLSIEKARRVLGYPPDFTWRQLL